MEVVFQFHNLLYLEGFLYAFKPVQNLIAEPLVCSLLFEEYAHFSVNPQIEVAGHRYLLHLTLCFSSRVHEPAIM